MLVDDVGVDVIVAAAPVVVFGIADIFIVSSAAYVVVIAQISQPINFLHKNIVVNEIFL